MNWNFRSAFMDASCYFSFLGWRCHLVSSSIKTKNWCRTISSARLRYKTAHLQPVVRRRNNLRDQQVHLSRDINGLSVTHCLCRHARFLVSQMVLCAIKAKSWKTGGGIHIILSHQTGPWGLQMQPKTPKSLQGVNYCQPLTFLIPRHTELETK